MDLWKKYEEKMFALSAYNLVLATVYYDCETIAPQDGEEYRNSRIAYIDGEAFSLMTDPELFEILEKLNNDDSLDDTRKRIVRWQLADLEKSRYIPKELYMEYSEFSMLANQVWKKAKQTNDYELFKPYLKKMIDYRKKLLSYRKTDLEGYNIALDDYEPGMTIEKYDEFFDLIRRELVPLIKKICETEPIDESFVHQYYPEELQAKLSRKILDYMDYDKGWGYLATTEHPFSNAISKWDSRITTHYYEDNLISSIFSIIHEAGHATYNHQVADELADTYVFENMSSGMHESQSRLMENYLGRSMSFWDNNFEYMKQLFPEQLKGVSQEAFVRAANASRPSLIRTEADELTYPLHILIRYEIEKALFAGEIQADDLEQIWNDKYEEYMGIRPQKASEGILQDVHWAGGSFGYFPTYALGSGYAAQFMHYMRKDIDVDECMRNNDFRKIKEWLREHIHKYGGLYTPEEQIIIATGEPFNPQYYIDYLKEKYSALYNIK